MTTDGRSNLLFPFRSAAIANFLFQKVTPMQSALQIERKQTVSYEAGAVWLRTLGECSKLETHIGSALGADGIRIENGTTGPYGVVCFDEVDSRLVQILHESCRYSGQRVLAVATDPEGADPATIWRLLHAEAADVVPWNNGEGARRISAKLARWREVDRIATQAVREQSIIGESPAWHALIRKVVEAARFSTIPILLTGESGTGKELLSRLVSGITAGGNKNFRNDLVTVDCGSLVPELSGSEFFGHERGAFTGAHVQREGAFAMADGATLLLDEIGEVPLHLQVQLLRAIQEKTYKRVGSNVWQKTKTFAWSAQPIATWKNWCSGASFARTFIIGSPAAYFKPRHSRSGKPTSSRWQNISCRITFRMRHRSSTKQPGITCYIANTKATFGSFAN